MPTVVLTNKGTASAAEIVAGAVRDRGIGILIGEPTFGKACVQKMCIRDSRYTVNFSQLPVVQVMGNQNLKTVKAWIKDVMVPVDIALTIGNTTYQLHRGKITARIPSAPYLKYELPEGNGTFLFPMKTPGQAD